MLGSSESDLDYIESSSEEEYKNKLRQRTKIDYTKGQNLRTIMKNKAGKIITKQKYLQELCNNFVGEKKYNYSFVQQAYTHQNFYNQNIFQSDREELDNLYNKHGREQTPKNMNSVHNSPYKKFWLNAILDEVESLKRLEVFELVKRSDVPSGTKILGLLTILKTKYKQDEDKIDKHKARICANGSAEQVDPWDTYAPTVIYTIQY